MKLVAKIEFIGTDSLTEGELERFITMWNALEVEIRKDENKEGVSIELEVLEDHEVLDDMNSYN